MVAPKTTLHVEILGQILVRRGASLLELGPMKQRAVFAVLALHPGQIVSIDALLDAVWGEHAPTSARHLVHTYVARLRQVLEPEQPPRQRAHVIESAPPGYRLMIDGGQVDVTRFGHLVGQARTHLDAGASARAMDLLGEAVRMWRDPMLTELNTLLHSPHEIEALRRGWLEAALVYVTTGLDHGQAPTVLPTAERLAEAEPLHEEVQARYLAVLDQTGQRAVAVERFGDIRARLNYELGIDPGPALAATYRELLVGGEHQQPVRAAPSVDAARPPWRGLGPGLGDLVQRDTDLDSLLRILSEVRLVTVTGPPGCGKSALALHGAARVRDAFVGGVAVADVSDTVDRAQLIGRLLEPFDAPPGTDDVPAVLGDQEILVILDNVEHLVDACATLADRIARACRYVSMIVTSREPLGLPYETVLRLGPLPVPDAPVPTP
jgi:DNA-binding SARP family transcriptional activator